ncbi:MAG TPA: response regulator [Verrucomicrobiae bacterium]|jgi:DNA-binding NarL/FixJ family response regulator
MFQPRQVRNELAAPVQPRPAAPVRIRPSPLPGRTPEKPGSTQAPAITDQSLPIPKIRVALVDDDQSIHIAMRQVFKNWASHWSLESFLDGNEAIERFRESPPHVVLMDISMPDVNGIECTRRVKTLLPHLPVIMFTARMDTESFILAMIAGASGYLIKPIPSFDIVSAIKKALEGMPALCVQTEKSVVQWIQGLGEGISGWGLTAREQQIILHLCSNRSDKEIAEHLDISPGTVHTHLVPLFRKLGVHTRDEAKRKFLGLEE